MVVDEQFIREGHFSQRARVVTSHWIAWKVIFKLNWTKNISLRVNLSNYQNLRKVRKFWGIDLYAILKLSAKKKLVHYFWNYSTFNFRLFIMYSYGKTQYKKMLLEIQCIVIYQSLWKLTYNRMRYQTKLLRNFRKTSSIFFLQLNINDTKALSHEYISSKNLEKIVSNIQGIDKIQREIKKNLCRFSIKIRNYYFWLLFVARKKFLKFDKLLAGMVTKVHP